MTTHKSHFLGVLVLAGASLAALPAWSAAVPDPQANDIFVGFRASGTPGNSTSYLVKLGSATAFLTTPGTAFDLSIGNIGLDLAANFGADWHTRSDLYWGIFGAFSGANPIVFGSKERSDVNTPSTPWAALDLTARNSVDTQITSVLNSIGGYRGREATANSAVATLQPNTGSASSYNFQVGTPGTLDFSSLSGWDSIEGSFANGASGTVLDLYRIAGSGVTSRGSFSIDEGGQISYFVVPEPSSAVLLVLAGSLLGFTRRRAA